MLVMKEVLWDGTCDACVGFLILAKSSRILNLVHNSRELILQDFSSHPNRSQTQHYQKGCVKGPVRSNLSSTCSMELKRNWIIFPFSISLHETFLSTIVPQAIINISNNVATWLRVVKKSSSSVSVRNSFFNCLLMIIGLRQILFITFLSPSLPCEVVEREMGKKSKQTKPFG